MQPERIALLLAAGFSRRYGSDKRLAGSPPLILRTLATLLPCHDSVLVVLSQLLFFALLRSDYNLRFRDPSMTEAQVLVGCSWLTYLLALLDSGRGTTGTGLLPIDSDKADALIAKYPFYTKTKIPAGTYAGFDEEVPTISVMSMLVVNDKVDDKLGYEIAKAIFSNLDRLQAAHSVGKLISKENAEKGMSLDMNAGAKKFFEESK